MNMSFDKRMNLFHKLPWLPSLMLFGCWC